MQSDTPPRDDAQALIRWLMEHGMVTQTRDHKLALRTDGRNVLKALSLIGMERHR